MMSSLNLISLLGLVVMILLAWVVSSHKQKVNWRLVGIGVLLQALLAALFFQSQNWTLDRHFASLDELVTAVETNQVGAESVGVLLAEAGLDGVTSSEQLLAGLEQGTLDPETVSAQLPRENGRIAVPRFPNGVLFSGVNGIFAAIKTYVDEGSNFVFKAYPVSGNYNDITVLTRTFAFGVLPTVIFFASLMAVLYHLGVMHVLIRSMAWAMQKTLGTSGPESMAAAANVLVGHTEAPLVIRPFVADMTRSELNALMVGGFATISGSLMAIFVASGISAGHLLTASLISAPAALVIAKIMQPETETTQPLEKQIAQDESAATNVIEAAAIGAADGVKLAINITGMLIAFLALLAMLNALLYGCGELVQWLVNLFASTPIDIEWTLNGLFSMLFYPLAWVMGIATQDCGVAGELLGKKMVVNEFIAYTDMAEILAGRVQGADGATVTISERTEVILTYALCGFSNFGAIGIQIGGIGPLAPSRRSDLAQLGLRAMFGGMLAACMTACMAGMMYGLLR